jgi:hypothetical protein
VKEKNPRNPVNPAEYQKSSADKTIEAVLLQKIIDGYKGIWQKRL